MVETKTAKRKAAAKTAAKTAAEISSASAAAMKKTKKEDVPKVISPPSNRTRSKALPASANKPAPVAQAKSAPAAGASRVKKSQPASKTAPARPGQKRKLTPDQEEISLEEAAAAPEPMVDSDDEDDDGPSQRLVVKLDKKQEKKLNETLHKIKDPVSASVSGESAVIYLGRIPHGLFEKEMRAYFTQFGEINRLRISRNKKTGKSKHYAFVEFEHPEVAQIVAETHNNMLICDRMVKCNVVPVEKIHETMFKGADEVFKPYPWKKMAKDDANRKRTVTEEKARINGLVKKERKRRAKLAQLGIEYDFPGFEGLVKERQPKRTKFE